MEAGSCLPGGRERQDSSCQKEICGLLWRIWFSRLVLWVRRVGGTQCELEVCHQLVVARYQLQLAAVGG